MAQVIIRNLDDRVVDRLKARARRRGHSLEQELRDILAGAAERPHEEKLALIDGIRATTVGRPHPLAEELIREDRERP